MDKKSEKILKNLKENSVGKEIKSKLKNLNYKIVVSTLALSMGFSTLCSCTKAVKLEKINNNEKVEQKIEKKKYTFDSSDAETFIYEEARKLGMKFTMNDLNIYSSSKMDYTIDDYKKVEDISGKDVIGFYFLSSRDKLETEKFIKAVGYDNWDDFLIKNNYVDENNKPSYGVWLNEEYQRIYDKYVEYYNIDKGQSITR